MMNIKGWIIEKHNHAILTSAEMDSFRKAGDLPSLPEMFHGNSSVCFKHVASGVSIGFSPREAILEWRRHCFDRPAPKVNFSEDWLKERREAAALAAQPLEYDWTFLSKYAGTVSGGELVAAAEGQCIPYDKLKIQEPILMFDHIVLFEDELSDNGSCKESVKMRVMNSGFFCLHRIFLRVDDVLVTINDTRIYHAFGSNHVIHEFQSRSSLLSQLKIADLSKLSDESYLFEMLECKELQIKVLQL